MATKLRPPSMGVRHMPRPRLSAGGTEAGPFRLALVSAPAGSGKTTVLSEWYQALRKRKLAAVWLSLDSFDNEPRRFLVQLISAVQAARPEFGRKAARLLAVNPDTLLEDLAESLVHDFGGWNSRIVVFLDDYHVLRDRAIHAMVDYLLRYVPDNVRFVIGTRKDPPLSIERFRLRGEVLEVGWEDLRFRVDEARDYLKEVCRLPLSEDQVRALCDRTEGWATGLQLASVAFAGATDPDGLVAGFTGAQRNIADYLLEDVFRRQPPAMRQFLMKTSILDRMTASLCDAVTGRQDGRQMIETLEGGNLFTFGLDDHRTWFRYHHLFTEFLRNRLRTEHPREIADLHDRASDWFEKNGFSTEAVQYAIGGSRFPRAARLLEKAGRELFRQGDFKELRRWIDALPERTVRRSPILCALHAWALAYMGEFEFARHRIACAAESAAKPEKGGGRANVPAMGPIQAELQVLRAVVGIIQTDEPDVAGLHSGIVSLFPRKESALRGYAYITLGFASRVEGYLSLALQHFRDALVVSDGSNSSLVNLNARLNIGIVNYVMGRANDAEESFRKSLEISRERLWLRSIGAAFLRYGLALVLYDRNKPDEALKELSDTIAFLEAGDAFGFLGMALVERARVHLALGRSDLADADIARARQVARKHNVGRVSFRADLLETRIAILAGKPDKAAEFLESAKSAFDDESLDDRPVYPEKYEYYLLERIRLLSALGKHEEAVELADRAVRSAESAGRGRNIIEFLVLQAAAWNGHSRGEKALEALEQALSLAMGEGIVRPFLNSVGEIAPLLRHFKNLERYRATVTGILSTLEDRAEPPAGETAEGRSPDPFHQREVQILKLVSEGLRNREIGRRLFLSEETVKWYLKGLYCKLHVGTRTEAIAKARRLGLIDGA
ncbi:MAG: AAA family ATPase [Deltaproteobacteria bacterium]|nr:AAA family ATPase [Deltaproteobacteria bacterium]